MTVCTHPKEKRLPYHDMSIVCEACNCVIEQYGKPINPPHHLSVMIPLMQEKVTVTDEREMMRELDSIALRVLAMCEKRRWSLYWAHRGASLHLESSELIEAIRGKRGIAEDEAGDVLLVLMSITQHAGIPFSKVIDNLREKLCYLEVAPPYPGEERECE